MSEQQAAATAAVDPIESLNDEQFRHYRSTGELPKAEPADAATVDAQEQTESEAQTESAGESETPKTEETQEQSRKPKNAAQRIAQLEEAIEAEWAKDEPDLTRIGQWNATIDKINGRPKRKTEAAPPQTAEQPNQPQKQAQNYAEWEQQFNAEKWIEEYAKANPSASYEKANAAMFSYMLGARDHFKAIEQQQRQQIESLQKIEREAREVYPDFDEVKSNLLDKIVTSKGEPLIPPQVLAVINDSDVLAHLLYALGSDEKGMDEFTELANTSPTKAIRYVRDIERGIEEEFEKQAAPEPKAPEKRQTQAPKPVTPVGGSTSRAFDVNDESLSDDEWFRQRNRQLGIK